MTMYWSRCFVCGKYLPTKKCSVFSEVCEFCCMICPLRVQGKCRKPVW